MTKLKRRLKTELFAIFGEPESLKKQATSKRDAPPVRNCRYCSKGPVDGLLILLGELLQILLSVFLREELLDDLVGITNTSYVSIMDGGTRLSICLDLLHDVYLVRLTNSAKCKAYGYTWMHYSANVEP